MTSTARDPAIQRVLAQRPDLPPHFAEVMAEASRPAPPEESVEEVPATKAVPAASPAPAPGPMSTMPKRSRANSRSRVSAILLGEYRSPA